MDLRGISLRRCAWLLLGALATTACGHAQASPDGLRGVAADAANTPLARADVDTTWTLEGAPLLFTSNRDGNAEIYLLPSPGAAWVNLTQHEAGDNWPVWSPDGTRIAFQSRRSGNLDIWVMNADGSAPTQLTDHPEPDYLPSWTPDGTQIVFTSWRTESDGEERSPHLYVMRADGSEERRLMTASLGTSSGADLSPDGKRMVFARKAGENGADIVVADLDGQNERAYTDEGASGMYNGSPTFSPDGEWIAFYSDFGVGSMISVVNVQGTIRRTVVTTGRNWYPRWSPDGRWLVYCAAVGEGDEDIDVFAVPVDGSREPIPLVSTPGRDLEGSWAP